MAKPWLGKVGALFHYMHSLPMDMKRGCIGILIHPLTDVTRMYDLTPDSIRFGGEELPDAISIRIDPSRRFQHIDGFGAAVTGSTAYNLSLMPSERRRQFLNETFSPDKYGFGYVRVSIGCSDFSLSDYTCCDTMGIEHFALTVEETKYVIPALKEILAVNPALKITLCGDKCTKIC